MALSAPQKTQALVVGYGSIGQRHARVLGGMGAEVGVVSRSAEPGARVFRTLLQAFSEWCPNYAVICNETALHWKSLQELIGLGFKGGALVEKPVSHRVEGTLDTRSVRVAVAYNLRFHPLIRKLRERVRSANQVLSARFHVGQYLPDWRPGRNYKSTYSVSRNAGGGVLRDLSHELDLALWFFGPWKDLTAQGSNSGELGIETEEECRVTMGTEGCPEVQVTMNYLDRPARREIEIQADGKTIRADLISQELWVDGALVEKFQLDRDSTYQLEHQAFFDGSPDLCDLDQGLRVVKLIEEIECKL